MRVRARALTGKYAPNASTEECLSCLKLGRASSAGATECVCTTGEYIDDDGECRKPLNSHSSVDDASQLYSF